MQNKTNEQLQKEYRESNVRKEEGRIHTDFISEHLVYIGEARLCDVYSMTREFRAV